LTLRNSEAGSNLVDVGRCAVRDDVSGDIDGDVAGWVVNSEAV
jgi:hypothetical protein